MTLLINEDDVVTVAAALEVMNPGRSSAAHIRDMIRSNLREGDNSYISTAGWTAFTWMDNEGQTHVKVCVMGYTALKYVERMSDGVVE